MKLTETEPAHNEMSSESARIGKWIMRGIGYLMIGGSIILGLHGLDSSAEEEVGLAALGATVGAVALGISEAFNRNEHQTVTK